MLLLLGACAPSGGEQPSPPPRLVLFLVDTLRADRLTPYGHDRPTSPNLERLVARGAVFDQAWSPAPWTLPATASLLTGVDPDRHGAGLHGSWRDLASQVPDGLAADVPTLAERLGDEGWRCEAFVTNPFVGFGLERGFESFTLRQTEAAEVLDWTLERLDVPGDERPTFLLAHLIDCHDPLLIPDEFVLDARPPGDRLPVPDISNRTFSTLAMTPEHRAARLRLYDGAVRYVDAQLGRLLDSLEADGSIDDTYLVFTSDHGEEVFESAALARGAGYVQPETVRPLGHGHTLFEEVLRVPLVIAGPGVEARGLHVPGAVATHDLVPTLLELLGVDHDPAELDARSLVGTLRGEHADARAVVSRGIAFGRDRSALLRDGWSLVRGGEGEATVLLRVGDPEHLDRSAEEPDRLLELGADLDALNSLAQSRRGSATQIDPAQRARLRALGYLDRDQE
ncbi:sulfatase [Engelhardtia mirabilis]|uniref:Choline-sulfatase n=1 Tax=Engelhardtia mirabilis TaxID=2528011 RepID=A0A518BNY6_9BACT|nr:Choline-sulfatase [Planctomycetes bacterium Pla133]QDV03016.1 Choline-sulfatase [Planctomycetes bacterium Pla86]